MQKEELKKFPYFTAKTLKAFFNKKNPEVTITRWKKKLITIEKGKYTLHSNPLIYATIIETPSYLSFRSALHLYQLTNQIPLKAQVICKKQKKSTKKIDFFQSKYIFGFEKIKIEGFEVFIAKKEKLLLDCVLYPRAGVFEDELKELLKEKLNISQLKKYLKKINNKTLTKKIGCLLEKNNYKLTDFFEKELITDKNYSYLNPFNKKNNKLNKKWKLYVPKNDN